ncbi:secretory lipase-domain-containing protein [Pseudomassariella vexata]|uniref:Secretory lipase-domain-containing protein n=1 Tax=Pseudomassariella vexata TaxID=1141098 RepID=A0A1Y2DAK3_9PEZI|nr:secretory lipase-domain-containing protein [Pseudomassariella vexata]ORY56301.1 secretory lipase-domain-containing protein [Pseudomassariella vexata]
MQSLLVRLLALSMRELPGTVLRIRLAQILDNASAAYNLLYRTSDVQQSPTWAVTTLFIPMTCSKSTPMVTYLIPYNSADIDDSQSYSIYTTFDISLSYQLGRGPRWRAVLVFRGGHAALDAVRAVLSADLGPNLVFSGTVLGGLAPNLTSTADSIISTSWAGLMAAGLVGVASQYPDAYDFLISKLKPGMSSSYFLAVENYDIVETFAAFAGQNMYDYFLDGRSVFSERSALSGALTANGYMGLHRVPQMPVFAHKPIHDQFSPVKDTDELVRNFCGKGASILYQRNSVGGHIAEITNGHQRALSWLGIVLEEGYTPMGGCFVQNITVDIDNSAN